MNNTSHYQILATRKAAGSRAAALVYASCHTWQQEEQAAIPASPRRPPKGKSPRTWAFSFNPRNTRGTLYLPPLAKRRFALTPAHAGNIVRVTIAVPTLSFNPRARGEHRGRRWLVAVLLTLTPAHAGNISRQAPHTCVPALQPPHTRGTSSLIITCSWRVSTPELAIQLSRQRFRLQVRVALEHLQRFVSRYLRQLEQAQIAALA